MIAPVAQHTASLAVATGLTAAELVALLNTADAGHSVSTVPLSDPAQWGSPIANERYVLISPSHPTG